MGAVIRSNKMRSISIVCVLSTAACLVLGSVIPVANEGAQPKKVICTFPDWAGYRPGIGKFVPANIEPERCTHIVYAFAKLDEATNTIAVADNWADIGEHFYQQVVGLKYDRYVNRKILLSIGGYNDSKGYKYSVMIADSKTRNIFVDSVVAFLKKYGFDGLNFDWEYPGCPQNTCNQPDDKENFVKLVEELGTALHGEGLLLSVATSANPHTIEYGLDLTGLAPHIDWFTVMTLDYHGSWDRYTAHASPLYDYPGSGNYAYNLNYTVHYFLDHGVDKTKIVVDIPFYGHSYTLRNARDPMHILETSGCPTMTLPQWGGKLSISWTMTWPVLWCGTSLTMTSKLAARTASSKTRW